MTIIQVGVNLGFYTYYSLSPFLHESDQLLVAESNNYYNQYLGTHENDGRCSKLPDMNVQEIHPFGHNNRNGTQGRHAERLVVNSRTILHNVLE